MRNSVLSIVLLAGLCVSEISIGAADIVDVSILQLIVTPEKFDGKSVRLIAFCSTAFEYQGLFLSKDDCEQGITKNAVWVELRESDKKRSSEIDRRYVVVEGVFTKDKGQLSMYSGTIHRITRLDFWGSSGQPRVPKKNQQK